MTTASLRIDGVAVSIDGKAVLLRGPSGSGRSDLALRLIDEGAKLISDEQALTLDSTSSSMNDWVRQVFLTVRSGHYDRMRDYFLVVREATPPYVEVLRAPVRIDLAFTNDF